MALAAFSHSARRLPVSVGWRIAGVPRIIYPTCHFRELLRMPYSWDVFCRVVDNFGDAGVCWRLSRQLAIELGMPVRLCYLVH